MKRLHRHLLNLGFAGGLLTATLIGGCADPPPMLLVRGATPLDDSCVASGAPATFLGQGTVDVSIANGYILYPNVENTAPSSSETGPQGKPASGTTASWGDLSGETNRVILNKASVSYSFRTSGLPAEVTSAFSNAEIGIGGTTIDPNGSSATVAVAVLNSEHITALQRVLQPGQTIVLEVSVLLKGQSTGDRDIESNEFTFPIQICTQCLVDSTCSTDDQVTVCHQGQDSVLCTGTPAAVP